MASPTPDPPTGTGTFGKPTDNVHVTDHFGAPRSYGSHLGVDFRARTPLPVSAMDGGTVLFAGTRNDGFGVRVIIDHGNGMVSAYAHLTDTGLVQGATVERGDVIGRSGSSGGDYVAHLHVEVNRGGNEDGYREGRIRNVGGRPLDFEAYVPGTDRAFAGSYLDRISLQRGDKLPVVAELQRDLIAAGYPIPDGPTGYYGEQTEAAVRALQTATPGLRVDGEYGRNTRNALQQAIERQPTTEPPTTERPTTEPPTPDGQPTVAARDTPGPFAAVATDDLISRNDRFENGVAFSSLNLEQTRATVRAVFGDGVGAETLSALGAQHGDERTFLQRVTALGVHEGALSFGRLNDDPKAGINRGTFQEGGSHIETPAQATAQYERRITAGIAVAERALGRTIEPGTLSPADRDVMAMVGNRSQRGNALDLYDGVSPYRDGRSAEYPDGSFQRGNPNALFELLADPTLTRAQTIEVVSRLTQGGIAPIGESVAAWTTPGGSELTVDLAAVERRGQEPDATRGEPALGTLRRGDRGDGVLALQGALAQLDYDLGTTGPAQNGVDGDFGSRTRAAVQAEQTRAGLTPNGVVGPDTWRAIAARVSPEIAPTTDPAPTTSVPTTDVPPTTGPAAPTEPASEPQQRVAEAYRTLSANPDAAVLLDQVDGLARNLLNEHTGGAPDRALGALTERARTLDRPLTAADVQETLRTGTPTVANMPTLQAEALAGGLNAAVAVERAHPEVAAARETLREAQSDPAFGSPSADPTVAPTPDRPAAERPDGASPQPYQPVPIGAGVPSGDGAATRAGDAAPEVSVSERPTTGAELADRAAQRGPMMPGP